ncbi:hypothetical protein FRC00_004780 [Tulasnella sp. 408]|nr:hypothetical protein FRC00_004780 [Tulasnella sp. 408]
MGPESKNLSPRALHRGQIANFWNRYESVADEYDRKASEALIKKMDVLLVFAALFSAITTAFLILTVPALSPDPKTETNDLLRLQIFGADEQPLAADQFKSFSPKPIDIAINCFLAASLQFSVATAIGAVVGREWLETLDRLDSTGPVEDRGRLRQRKFDGAKRWQLEPLLDLLPAVMMVSMCLFAGGIVLFAITVNKMMAAVIIANAGFLTLPAFASSLAYILFEDCPYDTTALRCLGYAFWIQVALFAKLRGEKPPVAGPEMVRNWFKSLLSYYRRRTNNGVPNLNDEEREIIKNQRTNARSAWRLLEMTTSKEDQLIAVEFLSSEECAAENTSPEQQRLIIARTLEAFDIWHDQKDEKSQERVEQFGKALLRLLPAIPNELTTLMQDPRLDFGKGIPGARGIGAHS